MAYRNSTRRKRRNLGNNPDNPNSTLFKKLTKLFSGPIINYRQQHARKLRRHKLDKYASTFKSASGQQFKKKTYNPYDHIMTGMMKQQHRSERYGDFDQMEYTPELASALDIYADEITTHTQFSKVLKIECQNEEIKNILETLFYQVMNVEFNLYGWARTLCKYGDFFLYLDIDDKIGIKSAIGLPVSEVERLEGEDPTNPNYIQYQWNSAGMTLENWQVAHFRVLGNDKYAPYGTSVLDPARRIWRQMTLLEDAMMAYRIVRAPDRRVFYIDVGGIPPEEVEQFVEKAMTQMRRHSVVDASSGQIDLRYNPASIEEDFWIPVRGGASGTKIENLGGQQRTGDIDDVKYLRDKLFAAIKIPMSYLIRGEGGEEDKTSLAQKDIRFARTIQRLQRSVISELEKVAIVHLYTLGYKGHDLVSFKLHLHNPSKIAELQEIEHWTQKLNVVSSATEQIFSRRWVAKNILNISEEEFVRNQRERFFDKKIDQMIEKAAEAVAGASGALSSASEMGGVQAATGTSAAEPEGAEGAAAEGGEDMGLGGGDLGGDLGAAAGGEEGAAAAPPEVTSPAGGEDEGTLLAAPAEAAPGKRDDGDSWIRISKSDIMGNTQTTTSKSKGKWHTPQRKGMDRRQSAARRKNMMAQAGPAQFGRRGIGVDVFDQISKGIVSENKSNYNDVIEDELFQTNLEVRMLLESLERKTNEV